MPKKYSYKKHAKNIMRRELINIDNINSRCIPFYENERGVEEKITLISQTNFNQYKSEITITTRNTDHKITHIILSKRCDTIIKIKNTLMGNEGVIKSKLSESENEHFDHWEIEKGIYVAVAKAFMDGYNLQYLSNSKILQIVRQFENM